MIGTKTRRKVPECTANFLFCSLQNRLNNGEKVGRGKEKETLLLQEEREKGEGCQEKSSKEKVNYCLRNFGKHLSSLRGLNLSNAATSRGVTILETMP